MIGRMTSTLLPRAVADRLGPTWTSRLSRPGYLLLPLRAFLGLTFCYAGLQKLANPAYLDAKSPTSVVAQMNALRHQSPIGPLLSISAHAPTFVGVVIAVAELAVGIGTLLGLLSRVAAAGGALLALTFFLTVSWNTTPYYYGSDIVFVFAWLVLIGFGSGGVLSLDAAIRERARARVGLGPTPAAVTVPASRLRELCGRQARCGLSESSGQCDRMKGCPVFAPTERLSLKRESDLDRRTVLLSGAGVAGAGVATVVLAGATAAIGRALHSDTSSGGAAALPGPTPSATTPSATTHRQAISGTVVARAAAIPVGQAKAFTDPKTQQPAWLVHASSTEFVAFSAVCTHAGCSVSFDPSGTQFVCPCHGGTYDARTGQVTGGPPPSPLPSITVQVSNGDVSVT
jgi:thiosulfate dehydrogenase [quinone] large subunit